MKKLRVIILLFVYALVVLVLFKSTWLKERMFEGVFYVSDSRLEVSMNLGIDYLKDAQLSSGEFKMLASKDPYFNDYHTESSPFITSFVLYSLKDIENKDLETTRERALDFLLRQQEPGGVWRFWTKEEGRPIDPDLDDMSTISFILDYYNKDFDDNVGLIDSNRTQGNLFYTWIDPKVMPRNDVDCVVNANVLLYKKKNDIDVCGYLKSCVKQDRNCSLYYPDKLSFYYMLSRAYVNGVSCLGEQKEVIVKRILSKQQLDGSFGNDLSTALAVNALLDFGYSDAQLQRAFLYLLKTQADTGSWNREVFFFGPAPFYGSDELTTALVIEGINKYLNNPHPRPFSQREKGEWR